MTRPRRFILLVAPVACALLIIFIMASSAAAGPRWFEHGPLAWRARAGVQAVVVADPRDDDPSRETVDFGVNRTSLYFIGRLYDIAHMRIHVLGRAWDSGPRGIEIADAEVEAVFHPAFGVRAGRFKKRLTDVFTPGWVTHRFLDMPGYYRYAAGDLGLAGRGQGVLFFGRTAGSRPLFRYYTGLFDGLEAARKAADGSYRTDDGLQLFGRVELRPIESLMVGVAGTYHYGTTLHTPVAGEPGSLSHAEQDLMAYVLSVEWNHGGATVEAELLGHAILPESGASVWGGGFRVDTLYRFPLPIGDFQPGVRYGRHYEDFSASAAYHQEVTGVLNWWFGGYAIRLGLEFGWSERRPLGGDALQVLFRAAFFVE